MAGSDEESLRIKKWRINRLSDLYYLFKVRNLESPKLEDLNKLIAGTLNKRLPDSEGYHYYYYNRGIGKIMKVWESNNERFALVKEGESRDKENKEFPYLVYLVHVKHTHPIYNYIDENREYIGGIFFDTAWNIEPDLKDFSDFEEIVESAVFVCRKCKELKSDNPFIQAFIR